MPPMKSDAGWLEGFRARYAEWLPQALPFMQAGKWLEAFQAYPFARFEEAPWAPAGVPLAASRVAMVTTGGLYLEGRQTPFEAGGCEGDWTARPLPRILRRDEVAIAHDHIPHGPAEADLNVIFPLDRLGELAADGVIGEVAPTHWSVMGYCPRAADLAEETAPAIAEAMVAEGVTHALVIPI